MPVSGRAEVEEHTLLLGRDPQRSVQGQCLTDIPDVLHSVSVLSEHLEKSRVLPGLALMNEFGGLYQDVRRGICPLTVCLSSEKETSKDVSECVNDSLTLKGELG